MVNQKWLDHYPTAVTHFLPEGQFDHSPVVITVYPNLEIGRHPFKYYKMWSNAPNFLDIVRSSWSIMVQGTLMFQVVQKLKNTKLALKKLNREGYSDIQCRDIQAYQKLIKCQENLQQNPRCAEARREEDQAAAEYRQIHKSYQEFLTQKAKMQWCKDGDENTAIFHQSIKNRRLKNTVIAKGPVLKREHIQLLSMPYTAQEVKEALFSIPGDKSPGPDGYGTHFFRDAWDVIGEEIIQAVLDMIHSDKLLSELNATTLTLVPKVRCPSSVSEFRPIACCNTLYKCITKMICKRLSLILPEIIAENQGAFVKERFIAHNIMVCQDLVRHYGRKNIASQVVL
ncbi:uncharacterized protein LOC130591389 [Beta vulgaris subsp. vulgaris]|uniref:uncharacterized protein LOC130591389 n=1 Tax=Beta vulgaris subsp. vulgaris TaxID=3555 RepID=UPI0025482B98|nr:uncharacterized protein LOC130591389 [Beta vulgaris subsp. vulgaris]